MKALLLSKLSHLELVDFPDLVPAEDEVLIRVRACGICGSDIHGWDGSTGRRNPPLIMGHEASGEIVSTGSGVSGWKAGDRVTFDSTIYCGKCESCRRGAVNLCTDRRVIGVAPAEYRQHGAFAELLAVPARVLYRLPDGLTYERAAMVEPVSIALHALSRVAIEPSQSAVVVGSGMIGMLVTQALRSAGVQRVIAVDLDEERLALAQKLGATDAVVSRGADVVDRIRERTGAAGADISFEVVGITPTVAIAINCLRLGGSTVLVGNLSPQVEMPLQAVVTRELSVRGSCSSAGEYPHALELIASGAIKVDPMISATAPLDSGAAWFHKLSARDGSKYMKVLLQP